jgi:hypothetical protein
MGKQFRIRRTIGALAVVSGGAASIDLPRGYDFESVYLRLNGTITNAAGGTAVRAEAPSQVISRVEVVADGRNTIYSAPYWYAVFGNYARAGMAESGARMATPPSAAAAATYTVEANGVIDFATMDGERPKDTNFRTSGLQLLQLRLQFGNPADMWTVAPALTGHTLQVEVNTSEIVEMKDEAGNVTSPTAMAKTSFQEFALTVTNANSELRLPAGNLIKGVTLRTEGAVTAGEPSTTNLQAIQAYSGVDVRQNLTAGALRALNNNDLGFVQSGYYHLDFTRNGGVQARLSELWDVTNQAEPKVSLNVTGFANGKGQIVVREYLGLA